MRAGEIRALARRAGIAPGVSVLDLCCGVAGPGRFITEELGCTYLGVDFSPSAIEIARERARRPSLSLRGCRIPPIPPAAFDVVLLLETMLAFPEKEALLAEISGRSASAGGSPSPWKRACRSPRQSASDARRRHRVAHPAAGDARLPGAGRAASSAGRTTAVASHRAVADSLIDAFAADAGNIAAQIGRPALDELLAAHRLWSEWLREGRVRKLAFVAEKAGTPRATRAAVHGTV